MAHDFGAREKLSKSESPRSIKSPEKNVNIQKRTPISEDQFQDLMRMIASVNTIDRVNFERKKYLENQRESLLSFTPPHGDGIHGVEAAEETVGGSEAGRNQNQGKMGKDLGIGGIPGTGEDRKKENKDPKTKGGNRKGGSKIRGNRRGR
ncbi:hypothetical protein [Pasteuria penetrans]|uniref:hypothetical protein n=1 Tax=Pasteuria penetrans TaxID=86005 RepID=UPI0011ED3EE7|nr:hypothetical protein [Pasteuria penetrans]